MVSFGARDIAHPLEHGVMVGDFRRVGAREIYHYSANSEPAGGKLEPRGAHPKSWPTFEELAQGMGEGFVDFYGTMWQEDILSPDLAPNSCPIGYLFVLRHLHRKRERKFNIDVVRQLWEEAFDHFRTCAFRNLARLILRTGKHLPTKEELLSAAFSLDASGETGWVPPPTFRTESSAGFLRSVVFPRMEFDREYHIDTLVDEATQKTRAALASGRGAGPPPPQEEELEDGRIKEEQRAGSGRVRVDQPQDSARPPKGAFPLKCTLTPPEQNRFKQRQARTDDDQGICYKFNAHAGCVNGCQYPHVPIRTRGGIDASCRLKALPWGGMFYDDQGKPTASVLVLDSQGGVDKGATQQAVEKEAARIRAGLKSKSAAIYKEATDRAKKAQADAAAKESAAKKVKEAAAKEVAEQAARDARRRATEFTERANKMKGLARGAGNLLPADDFDGNDPGRGFRAARRSQPRRGDRAALGAARPAPLRHRRPPSRSPEVPAGVRHHVP